MTSTVLVTGASGRLGRRVVAELERRGGRTRALVRTRGVEGARELVRGDLLHPETLEGIAASVDVAVHLAGVTHARRARGYEAGNVDATRNLLAALRGAAPHVVYVSTRAIDPAGGAYSRSKLAAEELVRRSGLPFTILRLAEVFGLGGREGVDAVVARARRGRTVVLPAGGEVCPVHADDAVTAIANATELEPAGATWTIAGDCLSLRELAQLAGASRVRTLPEPVLRVAAAAAAVLPLPIAPDQPARLRAPKHGRSAEAEAALGFRARPIDEFLRS